MTDTTQQAPAPAETALELPEQLHSSPERATAAARFRDIQHILLEAEKRNYIPLLPDYDDIPEKDRRAAISSAVQAIVRENLSIIHTLQSTTATGPRGRKKTTNATTAIKAAPKPMSLDDL